LRLSFVCINKHISNIWYFRINQRQFVYFVLLTCGTFFDQANLAVEEAKLNAATADLNRAQAQLDDKQKELDLVTAEYDKAMTHKQVVLQVSATAGVFCSSLFIL